MWLVLLVLLVGCREPGRFVKVVIEGRPCALTSTGRVACSGAEPGDAYRMHWVDVPVAADLDSETETICSAGNSGVRCFSQEAGRGPDWAPHNPGHYSDVAMSQWNMCTLDEEGAAQCFGQTAGLASGQYSQLAAAYSVCGLDGAGRVDCVGPDDWDAPALPGTYDLVRMGDVDQACGLSAGELECSPKEGEIFVDPPVGVAFSDIHLGFGVICGLQTNGGLMCWGYESDDCLEPMEYCPNAMIAAMPAGTFSQVWANFDRACAVDTDGCVICWPGDWGWGEGKAICADDVEPPIKGGGTNPGD